MNFETLKYEKKGPLGILTINRPQALNALNARVLEDISQCLLSMEGDREIRVLILTGAGEKAFVAGADIKELQDLSVSAARNFAERGQKLFRRLEILNVPVIAAVNGFALGGGFELALACDFIVASDQAQFGLPEVKLGIMPGFGGTQRLARAIGRNKARELTYTGEMLSANQALQLGLVTQVVPAGEALNAACEVGEKIAKKGPMGVAACKRAIDQGLNVDVDEGLIIERELFANLFESQDAKEGIAAFVEKRKPAFRGL